MKPMSNLEFATDLADMLSKAGIAGIHPAVILGHLRMHQVYLETSLVQVFLESPVAVIGKEFE